MGFRGYLAPAAQQIGFSRSGLLPQLNTCGTAAAQLGPDLLHTVSSENHCISFLPHKNARLECHFTHKWTRVAWRIWETRFTQMIRSCSAYSRRFHLHPRGNREITTAHLRRQSQFEQKSKAKRFSFENSVLISTHHCVNR